MQILVGNTGFVGGNIAAAHKFDMLCNSKNISEAFGKEPDLLVYAGVPAEMYLANHNPNADKMDTENAMDNIRRINPKCLVLISTIAVLNHPIGVDESVEVKRTELSAYGMNRFDLEKNACAFVPNCHILRLPALFGKGIKKNFLYDIINFFPAMLNKDKYDELSQKEAIIAKSYILQDNNFYKLSVLDQNKAELRAALERCNFSALNFTDSRSIFQYYNLSYTWNHIAAMMEHGIPLLHAATEPLSAKRIYEFIYDKPFVNEPSKSPFRYDFHTMYAELLDGRNGYLFKAETVLKEIKKFVRENVS